MKNIPSKIISESSGTTATVYLYGIVGQNPGYFDDDMKEEDITDVAFLRTLRDYEKKGVQRLNVRINSPGGSMLHMDGIIALLQSTAMEVHTYVDGMAASAAADIFLAAKKENRHIARNGKVMIHAPLTGIFGNAKALRTAAEMLDKFEEASISQMASDTGMTEDEVRQKYYDGEDHWLTAKDALDMGLVSSIEGYEAQKMPAEPEKMTPAEIIRFFQEDETNNAMNFLQKLYHAAFPDKQAAIIIHKKEEEMTIENFKASLGSELNEEEVVQHLTSLGYDVKKTAPAPPPVQEPPVVQNPLEAVAKMLQENILALKADLEVMKAKLDKAPGAPMTLPKSDGDPIDPANDEYSVLARKQAEAAEAWRNPYL